MNSIEQARFNPLYKEMQQALLLQGMRPKTIASKQLQKMFSSFSIRWEDQA